LPAPGGATSTAALRSASTAASRGSSRFWPADGYRPGRPQPSFDKQPLRDWLDVERHAGRWNGEAPPPRLPPAVVDATSKRYLEAYRRITGMDLDVS
jgi:phosphoribosylaminoimidazole-succinocarboxamide synthase